MKHFFKCSIHKLFAKSNFNKVLFFFLIIRITSPYSFVLWLNINSLNYLPKNILG